MSKQGLVVLCTMALAVGASSTTVADEADGVSTTASPASAEATNGRIVYTKSWEVDGKGRSDIFTVRPDGTGGKRLTNSRRAWSPLWSPSGVRIAYEQDDAVWVMKANGSAQQQLTTGGLVGWMPSGGRVLVVRWSQTPGVDPTFLLHTIATGEEEQLPIDLPLVAEPLDPPYSGDYSEWNWAGNPVLAPDGKHLALMLYRTDYGDDGYDWDFSSIFTVRLDGTELTRVPKYSYAWSMSDWSPNGQQLLTWGEEPRADCVSSLRSLRLDGSSGPVYISSRCPRPEAAWSPDGRRIVYQSGRTNSLKIARKDGSHAKDVIPERPGIHRSQPDWRAGR